MVYRRDRNQKNVRYKNIFISIISLILVLGLSIFIANNLAFLIYKGSVYEELTDHVNSDVVILDSKEEEKADKNYVNGLLENNLIFFQGGVFTDLENAEEFRDKIEDKTLASIVNDGKYERIILGVSNKENFLSMSNVLKKNNIQFVRQVYRIPIDVKYNSEILEIVNLFVDFVLDEFKNLSSDEFDISDLKKKVMNVKADYGKVGSYEEFNELKDLILDLDSKVSKEDLESVIDFIYFNFKEYKV